MSIVYCEKTVRFKYTEATEGWKAAALTIVDVGYNLHLLMVTAQPDLPLDGCPRVREDLLVDLVHRAWVINLDEKSLGISFGTSGECSTTWPQLRFDSSESLWGAYNTIIKYRGEKETAAQNAKNGRLIVARYIREL